MKMYEIIRQRRLAKGMTQEQVAAALGVTAPAVNKWEKGTSCPDIALLPALARLLGTDLNTLFSFREEMTIQEISLFINELSKIQETEGWGRAYEAAMEKLREYPSCDLLILNTALWLDGAAILSGVAPAENIKTVSDTPRNIPPAISDETEALYRSVMDSSDEQIRSQARSMLISRYIGRGQYHEAEELIESLPDKSQVDKKQLEINLYISQGKIEEAARAEEERLLAAAGELQTILLGLLDIALKEERMADAEYIAGVSQKAASLLDLWEYNSYVAHFQLYMAAKNRKECLKILIPMLKSLTHSWEISQSPLYRHVRQKKTKSFGPEMRQTLLEIMQKDEETEFLVVSSNL